MASGAAGGTEEGGGEVKTPSGNGQPCYESLVGVTATLLEERIRRARWKEERVSMPAGIID